MIGLTKELELICLKAVQLMSNKIRFSKKLELGKLVIPQPDRERPIYRWFQMKESFSSTFVKMLLNLWRPKDETILDPFCGAGTVPLVCKELGIRCIGNETHPLLFFVSGVKIADYEVKEIQKAKLVLLRSPFERLDEEVPVLITRVFQKDVLEDLLVLRENLKEVSDEKVRKFLSLALLRSAMECSWVRKDGAVIKVKKRRTPRLRSLLARRIDDMCRDVQTFRSSGISPRLEPNDSREMPYEDESFGFVVTSPPYLFKNEYVRAFSVEEWILGVPPPQPERLIRVETPERYFEDMKRFLGELYRVCSPGTKVCLVASDGCNGREVVEVCFRLSEMASEVGFKAKKVVVVNERWGTTPSRRKLGVLKESLLFWEKLT